MALRHWSSTASENDDADATINWLEGQAASTVNNSARAMMAGIHDQYAPNQWHWVETSATMSVNSQTVFKLGTAAGDLTSIFEANRRVRLKGGTATIYGDIVSSSYTTETTVTIQNATGSLSASMSIAAVGTPVTGSPIPTVYVRGDQTATFRTSVDMSATLSVGGPALFGAGINVSASASVGHLLVGGRLAANGSASFSGTLAMTTGAKFPDSLLQSIGVQVGTWTPTFTSVTNLDSTPTATVDWFYIRAGSVVVFGGHASCNPTAASLCEFKVDKPVASNFANSPDAAGVANGGSVTEAGYMYASTADDLIQCSFLASNTSAHTLVCFGMYKVI